MQQRDGPGLADYLLILAAIGVVVFAIGFFVVRPMQAAGTAQAQAKSEAAIAQAQAQQAQAAQEGQTARSGAELRAENTARSIDYAGLLLTYGIMALLIVAGFGVVVFVVSWSEGKQTQRTLLILEHQRQTYLAQQEALRLAPGRVELIVPERERTEARRG
jgi:hypothetical protein